MEIVELIKLSKEKTFDELLKIVEEEITATPGYQISIWENFAAPVLYRARKHNHLEGNIDKKNVLNQFKSESEFWSPPKEYCISGRCQNEGEDLLYCSTSWETTISEVKPSLGDYISVSIYHARRRPDNPNTFFGSRIVPIGVQYLSQIDRLKHMFIDYDFTGRDPEFYKLDTLLDDIFHADILDTEEEQYIYNLSTAVTRCMMKNLLKGEVEQQMHGMIYSSIARNKTDYNFVLRPIHVRATYSLNHVQTFQVIEKTDNTFKLQLLRNGDTIGEKKHPLDFFEMTWHNVHNGDIELISIK
jgi:hypothetical protein